MKKKWLIISGICNVIFFLVIGVYLYQDMNTKSAKVAEVKGKVMTIVNQPYYMDKTSLFKMLPTDKNSIVFLGDSLTDYCEWGELLQKPAIKNRGIAGDTTDGVLNRMDEIITMKPAKIFLLIGTNDLIYGRNITEIVSDYEKIIKLCTQRLPGTQLYIQSIPPVNFKLRSYIKSDEEILNLNREIKKIANQYNIKYLDLHSVLVTPDGELASDYTTDGLHLTSKGYEQWKKLLVEYVD